MSEVKQGGGVRNEKEHNFGDQLLGRYEIEKGEVRVSGDGKAKMAVVRGEIGGNNGNVVVKYKEGKLVGTEEKFPIEDFLKFRKVDPSELEADKYDGKQFGKKN